MLAFMLGITCYAYQQGEAKGVMTVLAGWALALGIFYVIIKILDKIMRG